MACPMCTGTDCAGACSAGQCYWDELQDQHRLEDERREAEWLEDMQQISDIIGRLAQAFGDGISCRHCGWSDRVHKANCPVLTASPVLVIA